MRESRVSVNLEKMAFIANSVIPGLCLVFFCLGLLVSFYFHFLTVSFFLLTLLNFYYRRIQKHHTLLKNFGLLAQMRYIIESVGPEFRQYLYSSDTEEKPFNRIERSEVYQKAKAVDSSSSFGSQKSFDRSEIKIRHSMFPADKNKLQKFTTVFGEERSIASAYELKNPIMVSAMSYGALGKSAVRSLARGARMAEIPMNTGEGGYPKYHLMEECDLIFQLGTAKFGVRDDEGNLCSDKLSALAQKPSIKMVEIKLSQGAKPGKGGLLPKEKITDEISELRGVPKGKDVVSPTYHNECSSIESTVKFIAQIQEITQIPTGIKFCLGQKKEAYALFSEMKKQNVFPDYISVDGAEGGTGAAPKSFLDDVGVPLFIALPAVVKILNELEIRHKTKIVAGGKLINSGKQFMALCMGADALYSARAFMLAMGCIQALQCNKNTCPIGITTHKEELQNGLDVDLKAERIFNYVSGTSKDLYELLAATGEYSFSDLDSDNLFWKDHLI